MLSDLSVPFVEAWEERQDEYGRQAQGLVGMVRRLEVSKVNSILIFTDKISVRAPFFPLLVTDCQPADIPHSCPRHTV